MSNSEVTSSNGAAPPISEEEESAPPKRECVPPRVLTGKEAERVHRIFTRPARKPTPAMLRAIEDYKRLKAERLSD
jgi:hypothetical protein